MKITKNLTHVPTVIEFEHALTESELEAAFKAHGLQGFPAELDIDERTEEHVQMIKLDTLLAFAAASGAKAVTYDVTRFPQADDAEVDRQLKTLGADLGINPEVVRDLCEAEIEEYLAADAKRDLAAPVHSIVEAYVGGTAFAWYGMADYPRLKRIVLRKLVSGGKTVQDDFIRRASQLEVELLGF